MIELKNMTKKFKSRYLFQQLNMIIQSNKVSILLGENGAGKTTLLHIIAGLEKATSGEILENNQAISTKELQRRIGYIPQEIALWEHLTVQQNIDFFSRLKKGAISNELIKEYCDLMHLVDLKRPVEKLSGGTKRKANILIGLLHQPQLLILDEPTVGIDLKSRYEIHRLIAHLKNECTILMTTHHIDEVRAVADEIFILGQDDFYKEVLYQEGLVFKELK